MQVKVYVKEMKQRGRKWGFAPSLLSIDASGIFCHPP